MMKSMTREGRTGDNWPPEEGQLISFKSGDAWKTGILKEVRWGLVWRDFILDDDRVIPEIRVVGCPLPLAWRETRDVTAAEREACEERLASLAASGLDPREREQPFWAELNQYLAYTYLRYKRVGHRTSDDAQQLDEFPEHIKEVKRVVTGRLSELLEMKAGIQERESAAYSLGRLKDLETALQAGVPQGPRRSVK
jgi:hypothetical protein